MKFTTNSNNVGSVRYEYCLSCDGALSKRFEYGGGNGSNTGALASGYRFEYDGLNLLRMDQLYDANSNGLTVGDAWRKLWVNTYRPGQIAGLVGKRVYTCNSGASGTPSSQNDFTYAFDPVGNTVAVFNANAANLGNETYSFTQDALGLELSNHSSVRISERTNLFGATQWSTARTAGVWEHQTDKWIDPFTGDYFFHARWYDAAVGRFVGRDRKWFWDDRSLKKQLCAGCQGSKGLPQAPGQYGFTTYDFVNQNPVAYFDPNGEEIPPWVKGGGIVGGGIGLLVWCCSRFYHSLDCEAEAIKLVRCIEWRLDRSLSKEEIVTMIGPEFMLFHPECSKADPAIAIGHVDPSDQLKRSHRNLLDPDGYSCECNYEDATRIIGRYGWKGVR